MRCLTVGQRSQTTVLERAHDLAVVIAGTPWPARETLWRVFGAWLPFEIRMRSFERPELGDGHLLDRGGRPLRGGAYPIDLARHALHVRDDRPVFLVPHRRSPPRSQRGVITYSDNLFRLAVHARIESLRAARTTR